MLEAYEDEYPDRRAEKEKRERERADEARRRRQLFPLEDVRYVQGK